MLNSTKKKKKKKKKEGKGKRNHILFFQYLVPINIVYYKRRYIQWHHISGLLKCFNKGTTRYYGKTIPKHDTCPGDTSKVLPYLRENGILRI